MGRTSGDSPHDVPQLGLSDPAPDLRRLPLRARRLTPRHARIGDRRRLPLGRRARGRARRRRARRTALDTEGAPPKWFYDDRGSELFDEITRLPEYYPTRASARSSTRERKRSRRSRGPTRSSSWVRVPRRRRACCSTRSPTPERSAVRALRRERADLAERGDRDRDRVRHRRTRGGGRLRARSRPDTRGGRRVVAFLGGTIGNLAPKPRAAFLADVAAGLGPDDRLLLGTDLVKNVARLEAAYDDAAGVTAEFNRNVLRVVNRELDADFVPESFAHIARWNAEEEWIEMRLRAKTAQHVKVARLGMGVDFRRRRGDAHRDQRQVPSRGRRGRAVGRPGSSSSSGGPTRRATSRSRSRHRSDAVPEPAPGPTE